MKPYYSDYVEYAMRYYVKCQEKGDLPAFRSDADRANYLSCYTSLFRADPKEKQIVMAVYAAGGTLPDNVKAYCEKNRTSAAWVWSVIRKTEHKFACARGLI